MALTPCSSSFNRVSGTLGELDAKRRHCIFTSDTMYSNCFLGDIALEELERMDEGKASSKIEPRRVFNFKQKKREVRENLQKAAQI